MKCNLVFFSILCVTFMASSVFAQPVLIKKVVQENFSSNLPLVIIDIMKEDRIHGSYKIDAKMKIIEPSEGNRSTMDSQPSYEGLISIKRRGSSSEGFPKKQYAFKTQTAEGKSDNVSLLGMPHEHKWILNAPYSDKTLMRNYLVYHKTREINEEKYYAVRSHFVELFFDDGKAYHYQGVYVLMEKIKQNKERVKIKKLTKFRKLRITGGYILKLDKNTTQGEVLDFKENRQFLYEYPKADKITTMQKLYISSYLRAFQQALYSDDFNVTSFPHYYGKWIDEDAFIVHILSRELFLDADIWMFSEYIHKDENQKLFLSTVWDFNLGMGNDNYRFQGNFQQLAYKSFVEGAPYTLSSWVQRLMSDPSFYAKLHQKWKALRLGIWSNKSFVNFIDETQEYLSESANRNYQRWTQNLGKFVWPNRKTCKENGKNIYCKTFESAVEHDLKDWLIHRLEWMDKALDQET
ncbi:MAG: CotH kinase family protein [Sulfurovum sp.]|nr:CotH kinase family protein [Sulfurovum sp.]